MNFFSNIDFEFYCYGEFEKSNYKLLKEFNFTENKESFARFLFDIFGLTSYVYVFNTKIDDLEKIRSIKYRKSFFTTSTYRNIEFLKFREAYCFNFKSFKAIGDLVDDIISNNLNIWVYSQLKQTILNIQTNKVNFYSKNYKFKKKLFLKYRDYIDLKRRIKYSDYNNTLQHWDYVINGDSAFKNFIEKYVVFSSELRFFSDFNKHLQFNSNTINFLKNYIEKSIHSTFYLIIHYKNFRSIYEIIKSINEYEKFSIVIEEPFLAKTVVKSVIFKINIFDYLEFDLLERIVSKYLDCNSFDFVSENLDLLIGFNPFLVGFKMIEVSSRYKTIKKHFN